MSKKSIFGLLLVTSISLTSFATSCVPNSAIPSFLTLSNPADPNNPINPNEPLPSGNPNNPNNPNGTPTPFPNNPTNPTNPTNPIHPPPPDPQQPTTEDDFWKLMQRFGFMQTRSKDALLADIKKGVAVKIVDWSPGQVKDKNKNILAKYKDPDTKKYMNPYPATVEEYTAKSFVLARRPNKDIDFYLDVEYGAKDGRGRINMQRIDPRSLEVLYYNMSGLITNYTQTALPKAGGPPPLLRLTHFLFIPTKVYQ